MPDRELVDLDINLSDMSVTWGNLKIGGATVPMNSNKLIYDPSYVGFHLPEDDFKLLGTKLNSLFSRFLDRSEGEVTCDTSEYYCYLESSCGYIRDRMSEKFDVSLDLTDINAVTFAI